MPALAAPLNPEEAGFGAGLSSEVDCFEDENSVCDAEADTSLIDSSVEVGDAETVALDDEAVLDGRLYPAFA